MHCRTLLASLLLALTQQSTAAPSVADFGPAGRLAPPPCRSPDTGRCREFTATAAFHLLRHGERQDTTLSASLRCLAGGAAAGQQVTLRGRYNEMLYIPDHDSRFPIPDSRTWDLITAFRSEAQPSRKNKGCKNDYCATICQNPVRTSAVQAGASIVHDRAGWRVNVSARFHVSHRRVFSCTSSVLPVSA